MKRHFFGAAHKPTQRREAPARPVQFHSRPQLPPVSLNENLLTTKQLCERFGFKDIGTIYRLVRDFGLPRVELGDAYRFAPSQVEAWIESKRQREAEPHVAAR